MLPLPCRGAKVLEWSYSEQWFCSQCPVHKEVWKKPQLGWQCDRLSRFPSLTISVPLKKTLQSPGVPGSQAWKVSVRTGGSQGQARDLAPYPDNPRYGGGICPPAGLRGCLTLGSSRAGSFREPSQLTTLLLLTIWEWWVDHSFKNTFIRNHNTGYFSYMTVWL